MKEETDRKTVDVHTVYPYPAQKNQRTSWTKTANKQNYNGQAFTCSW